MSNQAVTPTTSSSAGDQQPPWLLANLLSTNCDKDCGEALKSLLPGPFCVLQGSPGDGMANTLDSMPMLPIESMNNNDDEAYFDGRRSSAMNSSLHPLEEMAEDEEEQDESHYRANDAVMTSEEIAIARPHTPLDDTNHGDTSIIGRERSDSLTGGGLHYPLGEKSPIMQRRVRSLSLMSTLMQQPSTSSSSLHQQSNNEGRELSSPLLPLVLDNEEKHDVNNDDDVYAPILKPIRRRHNNKSKSTTKSTAEREAIRKWQREVSQQEQSHLEERNQNVKLLLDRRKRSQERMRHQLSDAAAHQDAHGNHRSGSPVALATATSASSSSSSGGGGSNSSYEGSNDGSGRSSPLVLTATPQTITVSPPIDNPINHYMNSLELEMSHRSWYQKDGRLVVFQSLPYMSSSGKVVVHPLIFEEDEEGSKQQQQEPREEEEDVITLAPGTTVMAEEAIALDSHSLQRIHSTAGNDDDHRKQQRHEHRDSTLVFLNISSPYPGYVLSHIHNYPYLSPGLPTAYTDSTWLWRVTCQPDGAFIRSGLDLVTHHIGTLPYGTLCCVKKKVVNYMGLNRLEIDAFVDSGGNESCSDDDGKGCSAAVKMNKLSGFISEFLNPLSGQRGNIVEQVSFPVPALYKVIHAEGAIIRSGVELSTGKIGFAPMGSVLSIVGRSYSSNPSNNCIERLRLAGGGGWISVNLNREDNEHLVEMIGADESFDPEDPASFHFGQQKKVMAELRADDKGGTSPTNNGGGGGNNNIPRRRSTANLSEIADDDQMSIPDSEGNYGVAMNDARASVLSTPSRQSSASAVPTLFQRSGVVGTLGGLVAMDAVRESSSDKHQNDNANRCLICLSDERTATIVHGETGHIACCLTCARILKARGDNCPVCRLPIDLVIQQFWA
mmetsp:Transcript_15127/g.25528  ORF Transcript_15127/g.25528 Transcript_15127/m.25528 type:complete len:893 (-) Transcript_15127:353-3031(-)